MDLRLQNKQTKFNIGKSKSSLLGQAFLLFHLSLLITVSFFSSKLFTHQKSLSEGQVLGVNTEMLKYSGVIANYDKAVDEEKIKVVFGIYDQANGGKELWTEEYNASYGRCAKLPVYESGEFSTTLGTCNSLTNLKEADEYYLGVKIKEEGELNPRIKISQEKTQNGFLARAFQKIKIWLGIGEETQFVEVFDQESQNSTQNVNSTLSFTGTGLTLEQIGISKEELLAMTTDEVQTLVSNYLVEHRDELRGEKGEVGEKGASGLPGLKGDAGLTGAEGVHGKDGHDGEDGTDGDDGTVGAQGPAGPTGVPGTVGANGTPGATGATGAKGDPGDSSFTESGDTISTENTTLALGSTSPVTSTFSIDVSAASNKPSLRYNGTLSRWEFSNDGSAFNAVGTGGSGTVAFPDLTDVGNAVTPTSGNILMGDGSLWQSVAQSNISRLGTILSGDVSAIELDPVFLASPANSVTSDNLTDWQTAYSWGNHSTQGYITDGNTNWDNSYGFITDGNTSWDNTYGFITDGNTNWDNSYQFITSISSETLTNKSGDISMWTNDLGYLTTEVDASISNELITALAWNNSNNRLQITEATGTWSVELTGFLESYTETDPIWVAVEPNYFNLGENEEITGRPAFNGGISGSTAPFSVDSTHTVANLNADYLDGVTGDSFLRSDSSDNYTSGTLALNSGTTLDVNGDLSVADTNIIFDGANTNLQTTGSFSINSDDFFIHKTSGNIGIGTTAPTGLLSLNGNAASLQISDSVSRLPQIELLRGSGNFGEDDYIDWKVRSESGYFYITSGSLSDGVDDRLMIDENGNVGIGEGNPDADLHLSSYSDRNTIHLENFYAGVNTYASLFIEGDNVDDPAFSTRLTTDTNYSRFSFRTNGKMEWGAGNVSRDVNLYRAGTNLLGTDDSLYIGTNVGIGTTAPGKLLHVYGSNASDNLMDSPSIHIANVDSASFGSQSSLTFGYNTTDGLGAAISAIYDNWDGTNGGGNELAFYTKNSSSDATPQERIRIDSSGNLGIGTASPSKLLTVAESADSSTLRILRNEGSGSIASGSVIGELQFDAADVDALESTVDAMGIIRLIAAADVYSNNKQSNMAFLVKGSSGNYDQADIEVMRLTYDGNVGIGTTNPSYKLVVQDSRIVASNTTASNGSQSVGFQGVFGADASLGALQLSIGGYPSATAASRYLYLQGVDTANYRPIILQPSGGNVGIGITAPSQALDVVGSIKMSDFSANGAVYSNNDVLTSTNPSDLRLKENINDLDLSLNKIMQLRPVTFDWRDSGDASRGFIAQEVEMVIPELVATEENGYKGIYSMDFIPYLVKGIQEQQLQIEDLNLKINEQTLVLTDQAIESSSSAVIAPKIEIEMSNFVTQLDLEKALNNYLNNSVFSQYFLLEKELLTIVKNTIVDAAVTFNKLVTFASNVVFKQSVSFENDVKVLGKLDLTQNTGKIVIPAGQKEVKVYFGTAFIADPVLSLTPQGEQIIHFIIKENTKDYFVLELDKTYSFDIQIHYLAFESNVKTNTEYLNESPIHESTVSVSVSLDNIETIVVDNVGESLSSDNIAIVSSSLEGVETITLESITQDVISQSVESINIDEIFQ